MAGERPDLPRRGKVPKLNRPIPATHGQGLAVEREGQRTDPSDMVRQEENLFSPTKVPQTNIFIQSSGEYFAVRGRGQARWQPRGLEDTHSGSPNDVPKRHSSGPFFA